MIMDECSLVVYLYVTSSAPCTSIYRKFHPFVSLCLSVDVCLCACVCFSLLIFNISISVRTSLSLSHLYVGAQVSRGGWAMKSVRASGKRDQPAPEHPQLFCFCHMLTPYHTSICSSVLLLAVGVGLAAVPIIVLAA